MEMLKKLFAICIVGLFCINIAPIVSAKFLEVKESNTEDINDTELPTIMPEYYVFRGYFFGRIDDLSIESNTRSFKAVSLTYIAWARIGIKRFSFGIDHFGHNQYFSFTDYKFAGLLLDNFIWGFFYKRELL